MGIMGFNCCGYGKNKLDSLCKALSTMFYGRHSRNGRGKDLLIGKKARIGHRKCSIKVR